jgi:NDP-sugar pyrophosphorylase family protein
MKAILLAGGKGTRLRPLTVHTPKPIVPMFNRPFLYYQIDQLRQVPDVDEVILSLNYQPRRIEEIIGEGEGLASACATSSNRCRSAPVARSAMRGISSPSR